jgi:putative tryptophan/tyrosine transport system substrate-binding protein
MMQRREFITLLGGAAAAWPLAARAQQGGPMRRVSVLMNLPDGDPGARAEIDALTSGLRELGWVEGRNIQIEYHWPAGDVERARAYAKEVVALKPDVLIARSTPAALALKAETATIPIVFVSLAEPTASGVVENLARPGGNATGSTNFEASIGGKLLGLLRDVSPDLKRVAIIYNPETAPYAQSYLRSAEAGAATLAVELRSSPIQSETEIEPVLSAVARDPGGGLVVIPDIFLLQRRDMIVPLVHHHRLPAIYANPAWTRSGGLMAYAADPVDLMRRAAGYVDRILKGASPGELPVQQPSKYEFSINLKTAKALGLDISTNLVALADEVIE